MKPMQSQIGPIMIPSRKKEPLPESMHFTGNGLDITLIIVRNMVPMNQTKGVFRFIDKLKEKEQSDKQ
jgi:hypothetical protein